MGTAATRKLIRKVEGYNPGLDAGVIEAAYEFARRAHQGQKRASGAPYIGHPLEVAEILADMRLDEASIVTALLHDVVEDTGVTLAEIRREFSEEIARLVDGVTKLTRIEMQSGNKQAENFRKLLLAMSEDIRVLIVKLADRTHNMRTIDHIDEPEKRRRIAEETLSVFAPLAERIGITHFQHELEDRAFAVVNAPIRDTILTRIDDLSARDKDAIGKIRRGLRTVLKKEGVEAEVTGRQKTPYSIWRKMERREVEAEDLTDIMAFRVVVADEAECYRALGIIHRRYKVVMGRFKDYISTPKPNGYRSIHTGVIGPLMKKVEIQIRTPGMHEVAERGVAAHWFYKEGPGRPKGSEFREMKWLKDLVNILENAQSSEEFLEHTEMEMYADQVFCFTPKGALIALPKESTAVDFAYAVHTDVGNRCVAARINGRTRQLATILRNGDQVEIVTSRTAKPNPEWENFVKTGRAKSLIRRFIRQEQQREFSRVGKALLLKTFRQHKRSFDESLVLPVLAYYNARSDDELFARVGQNRIDPAEVFNYCFPDAKPVKTAKKAAKNRQKPSLNIKGLIPGMAVHIGKCCHPLPGDKIVGIVTTGKGLTVHRVDCQNLVKFNDMPELWVEIEWEREQPNVVAARLEAVIANQTGSLASVTTQISQNQGNITNIQLISREVDFFKFVIDVEVENLRHMTAIIAALRANAAVESVERAKS